MTNLPNTMEEASEPTFFFDHPYPRYGLAASLADMPEDEWREVLDTPEHLLQRAARRIEEGLHRFRVHTTDDRDEDTTLRYQYVSNDKLSSGGQNAKKGYYISPHVVTGDRNVRYLIREARGFLEQFESKLNPHKSVDLKRSFAPFTTKLNEGSASLSNPKASQLEAVFSLVATVTPLKPAAQVDFTNQVMIPDLSLEGMIAFVRLFRAMQNSEVGHPLTLERSETSKRKRPPLFDGNYPDAPRSSVFGPVGLMGAIGQWAKRAGRLPDAAPVLDQMAGASVYLVSYDSNLMRQEPVGHHAARLAQTHNLPAIIDSLYWARFYKEADNKPDSPTKKNFHRMASRFLQLYTRPSFRDVLAFRVQYKPVFSPILSDFFMSEYQLDPDIVRSARAYGAYLNTVAYIIGKEEVEANEEKEGGGTGRDLYEAKARALAQLESTAMSARRPSALFAQLNVMAGRQANRDVPADAARFVEAVNTGEVAFDVAKDLILAYMRLRSDGSGSGGNGSSQDTGLDSDATSEDATSEDTASEDTSDSPLPDTIDADEVDDTGYVTGD